MLAEHRILAKNTAAGLIIAAFSLVFGFAMIWYIWWLAIVGLVGMVATYIAHTFNDDVDYYVQPELIQSIEEQHFAHVSQTGTHHDR